MPTGYESGKAWSPIGAQATVSTSAASRVWTLNEVAAYEGAGTWPAPKVHYEAISTTSGTTGVASIEFTSIPQKYQDLRIVYVGQSSGNDSIFCEMGTGGGAVDTSNANYGAVGVQGWNSSSLNQTESAWRKHPSFGFPFNNGSQVAIGIWDFPNYTSTNFYKMTMFHGSSRNSTGNPGNSSAYGGPIWNGMNWKNTGALDRIKLAPDGGITLTNYTCTLFGISG